MCFLCVCLSLFLTLSNKQTKSSRDVLKAVTTTGCPNPTILIHLCIVCGCFRDVTSQLSSCGKDQRTTDPRIFAICPLQEKKVATLLWLESFILSMNCIFNCQNNIIIVFIFRFILKELTVSSPVPEIYLLLSFPWNTSVQFGTFLLVHYFQSHSCSLAYSCFLCLPTHFAFPFLSSCPSPFYPPLYSPGKEKGFLIRQRNKTKTWDLHNTSVYFCERWSLLLKDLFVLRDASM